MLDALVQFGLSEKEAKIYLALLELGPSPVAPIAERAEVSRTNSYHLLTLLVKRSLVRSEGKGSKMIFHPENPERIFQMLKEKVEMYIHLAQEAKTLLPQFRALYQGKGRVPRIRFYDDVDGVIQAYEDTLTAKTEILACGSVEYEHSFSPGYFPAYYLRRTQNGIPLRWFLPDEPESRRIQKLDHIHLRKTYLVPHVFAMTPEINVYDQKVAIMSLKEKFAVIIESPEVADGFRKLFQLALERAEEYDGKKFQRSKSK